MKLITKKTTLAILVLGLVLTLCGNAEVNGSSGVAWVSWDSWIKNATSGSIPYKCGMIEVEILPMSVPSQSWRVIDGFKNTSPMYSNIDSTPYTSLNINAPGEGEINSEWSIVFDFVNTTLTSSGVFNVGNMFYSSYSGPFTEFQIKMYGEDDQTPYILNNLNFDEFALNGIAFDGPIEWDPKTGFLVPLPVAESQNSRFAFFNPHSGKIGKIEVHANVALGKQDVVSFGFGVLSDCSEDGWTTINGTVTFDGDPVNAMVLANGQYMFSNGDQEGLNIGEYELVVPLDQDGMITLFVFVDGLQPFREIFSP